MRQDSVLSPILSALYIALLICIFELRDQALNLNTSILSIVNNSLLTSQEKMYNTTMPELYSSYRVATNLMVLFGLVMEYDKLEIFHFSRVYNNSNLELNPSAISTSTLKFKTYWRYLCFYFDQYLSFKKHVCYYFTKALFTIKVMSMLENSIRNSSSFLEYLLKFRL